MHVRVVSVSMHVYKYVVVVVDSCCDVGSCLIALFFFTLFTYACRYNVCLFSATSFVFPRDYEETL